MRFIRCLFWSNFSLKTLTFRFRIFFFLARTANNVRVFNQIMNTISRFMYFKVPTFNQLQLKFHLVYHTLLQKFHMQIQLTATVHRQTNHFRDANLSIDTDLNSIYDVRSFFVQLRTQTNKENKTDNYDFNAIL